MKLCRLGHSAMHLTPIGLGCWQFSMGKGIAGKYWKTIEYEQARAIVRASLESGINWFDTAEAYGRGQSERVVAKALSTLVRSDQEVFIATKWMPAFRTASHITRSIHKRITALEPFPISLYQIHLPISFSGIRKQMLAMLELLRSNRIRAIGVSNFSAEQMREAHQVLQSEGYGLASNQIRYSLLDRDGDRNGILDACRELGITLIAYSPLGQGVLTGKYHSDPEALKSLSGPRRFLPRFSAKGVARSRPLIQAMERIAAAHDASVAQVALACIVQLHQGTVVAIPGATSVAQAISNAGALELELEQQELHELDALSMEIRV